MIDFGRVAIFPLPESVLFPKAFLPLHIFEPRYRKMTEDAIENGLPIAICMAKPGEDLAGHAEVFPIAGAGVLARHERLADGRFNIVLRGVARIRITEELPHRPYRVVRAEPLADRWPAGGARVVHAAATLRSCVEKVAALTSEPQIAAEVLRRVAEMRKDDSGLADAVASMFVGDAKDRQSLLEELSVEKRVERVTSLLAELILRTEAARRGNDEPVQ